MSDYIEREATVKKFKSIKDQTHSIHGRAYVDGIISMLQELPAADVHQVTLGKVTHVSEDAPVCLYGHCSVCGAYIQAWNFCPNCGADMRGE